jgi:hypothetical protein
MKPQNNGTARRIRNMPPENPNKPQRTGVVILSIGVALLVFTFINAFMFLREPFSILATSNLESVFGEALAPLIQACIRLMYLGIMGWIGSMLTVRGIPLVAQRPVSVASTAAPRQPPSQPQLEKQSEKATQPPKAPAPQHPPTAAPTQLATPTAQPQQEEPRAILIPPENQRKE